MKVYVIDGKQVANLIRGIRGCSEEPWQTQVDNAVAAMTPIDIPDGCQLAVARHEGDVMCSNAAKCDRDCYHNRPHRFDADLCDSDECDDTKVVVKCVPQLRVVQVVEVK
jgi:hypothetical protein